ncbi:MAG: hypothetical protein HC862_21880 [Scytonema sp. RU_4_4]|nr:hypothetical protein [Scytonema sp. RU_4_4]
MHVDKLNYTNIHTGLTPNQIKRLELIRSSIINIQDSPEFSRIDYYPDVTLADAVYAIEELLEEATRQEPTKPILKLTISRRLSLSDILFKGTLVTFFTSGFFAIATIFSSGMNEVNARINVPGNVNWEEVAGLFEGGATASFALTLGGALGIVAANVKE